MVLQKNIVMKVKKLRYSLIIVANLNEKQYLCRKYVYGKKQNISKYGNRKQAISRS